MSKGRFAMAAAVMLAVLAVAVTAYALTVGPIGREGPSSSPAYSPYRGLQEVVRAQRLELVTSDGKVWAELAVAQDGSRGLRIYDDAGQKRVELVLK